MNKNTNHASYSTVEELASSLGTDLSNGLAQSECDSRLRLHGPNEFKSDEPDRFVSKYLEQFQNPLMRLLLVSVVISVFMRQYDDAISISLAVLIVVTVAFVQEYRSEKSLRELSKLVPPACRALRNGRPAEFLAKYLVPGDIVLISTGDRVPADLRLVACNDLSLDESNLTGETEAATKTSNASRPSLQLTHQPKDSVEHQQHNGGVPNGDNNNNSNHTLGTLRNNVGTVSSQATVDCADKGAFNLKQNESQTHRDQCVSTCDNMAYMGTLVQSGYGRGIVVATGNSTQFGQVFRMMQAEEAPKSPLQLNMDELGKHLSIYSLCVIGVIVVIGWLQKRPAVEMFTIGVSLGVAAIPEGLPIVVTVTLALGVMRMARRKAVVKQLSAVETLGCIHVVCTDKTGTLTKNEMTVTQIVTAEGYQADVTGVGYDEMGEVIVRDLNADQRRQMQSIRRLLTAACLCNNAQFEEATGKLIGNSTEGAVLVAARKVGLGGVREEYQRLDEIAFSSERKFMAVKCQPKYTHNNQNLVTNSYYVKGAIEIVLAKCHFINGKESENQIQQLLLDDSLKGDILRRSEGIEASGLRVLALAAGNSLDELAFLGFVGIHDAPRNGVDQAIEIMQRSGIQVKMVTGDSKCTALSIARATGIIKAGGLAGSMSGVEIEELVNDSHLSEHAKAERISRVSVFYRTTPQLKVAIVRWMQTLGYVTAMTGDGVNDAVALKKANIGIAMGSTGTDVCKEAADVILMDDNLATIVVALEEGKGIHHNIRNFIRFQLSTSIAALGLIAVATIMHLPNPLNAMQILYINILMDGPPAQSLGVEKVDPDVVRQPPRNVKEPVLTRNLLVSVLVSAVIILTGTLIVFINEMSDGIVTPRDTTMTFTCFVFFDMFNALACRSQTKSVFQIGLLTNKAFIYSIGGSMVGQILVVYLPPFQAIFQTEPLTLGDIVFLLALSSTVFIVSEVMKTFKGRMFKRKYMRGTSRHLLV